MESDKPSVLYFSPSEQLYGGAEVCMLQAFQILKSELGSCVGIFPQPGPLPAQLQTLKMDCRFLPGKYLGEGEFFKLWRACFQLSETLRPTPTPTLIHTNSKIIFYLPLYWSLLMGRPLIIHWRDLDIESGHVFYLNLFRSRIRVVAVSQAVARALQAAGVKAPVEVIYDAVRPEFLVDPAPATIHKTKKDLGLPPAAFVLGMTGRLASWKGHEIAVRALKQLNDPKIVLLLAGEETCVHRPNYPAELRQLVRDLGLQVQVRFLGHRADIRDIVACCDVVLAPSRHEPFGMVVLEAMAQAKPVIATRAGGIPEMMQDGEHGFLIEIDDGIGLAKSIRALQADAALRQQFGQTARLRVSANFSNNEYKTKILKIYQQRQPAGSR